MFKTAFNRQIGKHMGFLCALSFLAGLFLSQASLAIALAALSSIAGAVMQWTTGFNEFGYSRAKRDKLADRTAPAENTREFGDFASCYATGLGGWFIVALAASLGMLVQYLFS